MRPSKSWDSPPKNRAAGKARRSLLWSKTVRTFNWLCQFPAFHKDVVSFARWGAYINWAHALLEIWFPPKALDVYYEYLVGLGAEITKNFVFANLFLGSTLNSYFEVEILRIDEERTILWAHSDEFGDLYFPRDNQEPSSGERATENLKVKPKKQSQRISGTSNSNYFGHSPGFDFPGLLDRLWQESGGRLSIVRNEGNMAWEPIPPNANALFGTALTKLDLFCAKHALYVAKHISRTYLFLGLPGGGKTTFAERFAAWAGDRLLRLSSEDLSLSRDDLTFLLDAFRPSVLLVEDLDHFAGLSRSISKLLTVFTDLKVSHPGIVIILTVNEIDRLPPALLRPGRVDEIVEFPPPGAAEAREILEGYLKEFDVQREVNKDLLLSAAADMTGPFLKEVARQCSVVESDEEIAALVRKMRRLQGNRRVELELSDEDDDKYEEASQDSDACDKVASQGYLKMAVGRLSKNRSRP